MHRCFWRFSRRTGSTLLWFLCECGECRVRDEARFWGAA